MDPCSKLTLHTSVSRGLLCRQAPCPAWSAASQQAANPNPPQYCSAEPNRGKCLEIWSSSFIPAALVRAAIPATILIPAAKAPIIRLREQISRILRTQVFVILAKARHCLLAGCCILHDQRFE